MDATTSSFGPSIPRNLNNSINPVIAPVTFLSHDDDEPPQPVLNKESTNVYLTEGYILYKAATSS